MKKKILLLLQKPDLTFEYTLVECTKTKDFTTKRGIMKCNYIFFHPYAKKQVTGTIPAIYFN